MVANPQPPTPEHSGADSNQRSDNQIRRRSHLRTSHLQATFSRSLKRKRNEEVRDENLAIEDDSRMEGKRRHVSTRSSASKPKAVFSQTPSDEQSTIARVTNQAISRLPAEICLLIFSYSSDLLNLRNIICSCPTLYYAYLAYKLVILKGVLFNAIAEEQKNKKWAERVWKTEGSHTMWKLMWAQLLAKLIVDKVYNFRQAMASLDVMRLSLSQVEDTLAWRDRKESRQNKCHFQDLCAISICRTFGQRDWEERGE